MFLLLKTASCIDVQEVAVEALVEAQTNGRMEVLTREEIEGRDSSGEEAGLCHSQ